VLEIHSIAGHGIGRNPSSESRSNFRNIVFALLFLSMFVAQIVAVALQAVIK
jgi:hypothetical protein